MRQLCLRGSALTRSWTLIACLQLIVRTLIMSDKEEHKSQGKAWPVAGPGRLAWETLRGRLRAAKISLHLCLDKEPAASLILPGRPVFIHTASVLYGRIKATWDWHQIWQWVSDAVGWKSCLHHWKYQWFVWEKNCDPNQQAAVKLPAASPANSIHVKLFYISSYSLGEIYCCSDSDLLDGNMITLKPSEVTRAAFTTKLSASVLLTRLPLLLWFSMFSLEWKLSIKLCCRLNMSVTKWVSLFTQHLWRAASTKCSTIWDNNTHNTSLVQHRADM